MTEIMLDIIVDKVEKFKSVFDYDKQEYINIDQWNEKFESTETKLC